MTYLFTIKKEDAAGKRMFHGWANPGPKHKILGEGVIIGRPSSTQLLFAETLEGLQFIAYHKLREPDRFEIYEIKELTRKELTEKILALMPDE